MFSPWPVHGEKERLVKAVRQGRFDVGVGLRKRTRASVSWDGHRADATGSVRGGSKAPIGQPFAPAGLLGGPALPEPAKTAFTINLNWHSMRFIHEAWVGVATSVIPS